MEKEYKHKQSGKVATWFTSGGYTVPTENSYVVIDAQFIENTNDWIPVEEKKEEWIPKVGEWVKWIGERPAVGKVVSKRWDSGVNWILDVPDKSLGVYDSCHISNLRPATPEEIASVTKPPVPSWVITAFMETDAGADENWEKRLFKIQLDGRYWSGNSEDIKVSLNKMLYEEGSVKDGYWIIWSVKYQDVEYSIGDMVRVTDECRAHYRDSMKIEAMVVKGDNLLLKTKEFSKHGIGIANVKKVEVPKPLFIAEDGVAVYPNTIVYLYGTKSIYTETVKEPLPARKIGKHAWPTTLDTSWKVFTSEANRAAWIEKNKPKPVLLVTEDGKSITDKNQQVYAIGITPKYSTFESSAQYITSYVEECKWFSTPEARTNWMIEHKPMFSIADIRELDRKRYGADSNQLIFLQVRTEDTIEMAKQKLQQS